MLQMLIDLVHDIFIKKIPVVLILSKIQYFLELPAALGGEAIESFAVLVGMLLLYRLCHDEWVAKDEQRCKDGKSITEYGENTTQVGHLFNEIIVAEDVYCFCRGNFNHEVDVRVLVIQILSLRGEVASIVRFSIGRVLNWQGDYVLPFRGDEQSFDLGLLLLNFSLGLCGDGSILKGVRPNPILKSLHQEGGVRVGLKAVQVLNAWRHIGSVIPTELEELHRIYVVLQIQPMSVVHPDIVPRFLFHFYKVRCLG